MQDRHHTHAFWFFGVLVALGVENAATPVVQHFLIPPGEVWPASLEALRLVVFLLVSVRFLLGAAVHFDEVRNDDVPGSYGLDFVSAFFHFLLLFAWSFTVGTHWPEASAISPFLVLLFCVVGYDLVWMLLCRGKTTPRARGWAWINGLTLLLSLLAFLGVKVFGASSYWEQVLVIGIVSLVSLMDLAELTSGKRYMIPAIVGLMGVDLPSSDETTAKPPEGPPPTTASEPAPPSSPESSAG